MRLVPPLSFALLLLAQAAAAQPVAPTSDVETVTSEAPKTPLEKAIDSFVKSYATPSVNIGKIPRWRSGICPLTVGLTPGLNLGVSALLRQVAAQVGAPVAAKEGCNTNVTVIFTRTPQAVLDDMAKNHEDMLGFHEVSQTRRLATMTHPVQAWYVTATRDNNGFLFVDSASRSPECEGDLDELYHIPYFTPEWIAVFHRVYRSCKGLHVTGDRVNDGMRSELAAVTIVVDAGRLGETGMKQVANYVAMLALSQTKAYETCQPLVSIVNVMTPGCSETLKPDTLSETDLAYLSALYRMDPDRMLQFQQSSIAHQMQTAVGKP
jgi:hypothetical protein